MTLYSIARVYLAQGKPIPLDIVFKLVAEGFDVSALEEEHAQ